MNKEIPTIEELHRDTKRLLEDVQTLKPIVKEIEERKDKLKKGFDYHRNHNKVDEWGRPIPKRSVIDIIADFFHGVEI